MNAIVKPDQPVKKHAGGRPTKYTPELLRKAAEYLEDYETYGDVIPSVAGLAQVIDVTRDRLHVWANDKNKKEFKYMMLKLKSIQEAALLSGGLSSKFNPTITKLVLSKHGYHDNPQANQGSAGITVNVNRGGVVIKSGGETLAIETDQPKGVTIDHE